MRNAEKFIAGRLRFKAGPAAVAITVSFLVITLSVAVSSGFRKEIRGALGDIAGDVVLCGIRQDFMTGGGRIDSIPDFLPRIAGLEGVERVCPVIYRSGILRSADGDIFPAIFKGVVSRDSSLSITIPRKLAAQKNLAPGEMMTAYFITDRVRARNLIVAGISSNPVEPDDKLVVRIPIGDLRRLNGWSGDSVSAYEITLSKEFRGRDGIKSKAAEIGSIAMMGAKDGEEPLTASPITGRFPQIFDWLDLIDVNVVAILAIMIIVAGFNMISGLLILLFRSIPTIGTLKAVGMTDRGIAGVFLRLSSRLVLKGMLLGNALTLAFCLLQDRTHLIKLNPDNYFVSFVPVSVNVPQFILYDLIAYAAIMLLLLIPSLFISRVDPAESVKVR